MKDSLVIENSVIEMEYLTHRLFVCSFTKFILFYRSDVQNEFDSKFLIIFSAKNLLCSVTAKFPYIMS